MKLRSSLNERCGNRGFEMVKRCRDFANWVENNAFIDLKYSGPDHTWFRANSSETLKSARLDRGLCNEAWRMKFEEGSPRNLPREKSGHCPILISTNGFSPLLSSFKPFRFQATRMHHQKFKEFVMNTLKNDEPLIPFPSKFASQLGEWNKLIFIIFFGRKLSYGIGRKAFKSIFQRGIIHTSFSWKIT